MVVVFFSIVAFVVTVDQLSKKYAEKHFEREKKQVGVLTFSLVKNPGAFKGFLKNKPQLLTGIQTVGTLIVALLGIVAAVKGKSKPLAVGLALITGGAGSNLVDRICKGKVTDFFAIKWTKNLYYNLADIAIFLGAVIVLFVDLVGSDRPI
jgi:signal peptidase II